jgi:hypothetical protein
VKFLCLCYYDTAAFERLSPADAAKIEPACKPHDERLRATGKVPVIGSFAMPGEWTSFVPEDGRARERPGPYTAGTRQAGAFFIVEARDMEEAKQVASKHPAANFGEELGFAVEIRRCELYQEGESK